MISTAARPPFPQHSEVLMTYVIAGSCVDLMDRASAVGPIAADTPLVAALPPRAD
jgi:hypothetical protein